MTSADGLRILAGTGVMAASCTFAGIKGDWAVRCAALLIAICWFVATAGQMATGLQTIPVMAANLIGCPALLLLAVLAQRPWLWAATGIEAALLALHLWLYRQGAAPGVGYIAANNLLSTAILGMLLLAALRPRGRGAPAKGGTGERAKH